ncbi:MAG: hypothetical protein IIC66_06460 [candidate division Zixibacteria bacterium]|nr:hypothetical protein [candidate division Zixibacteria bacterium]
MSDNEQLRHFVKLSTAGHSVHDILIKAAKETAGYMDGSTFEALSLIPAKQLTFFVGVFLVAVANRLALVSTARLQSELLGFRRSKKATAGARRYQCDEHYCQRDFLFHDHNLTKVSQAIIKRTNTML